MVEYRGDEATDLANPAAFAGKEIFFSDVAYRSERLWLTSFGGQPRLFSLQGETLLEHERPASSDPNQQIGLRLLDGELLVYRETLLVGKPGSWRPLAPGLVTDGIGGVEDSPVEGELCAIAWKGPSYVVKGGAWREVPIFQE